MPREEIVRRAPFPLYGLAPEWTGERRLHDAGLSAGEVTHVALRHVGGDGELIVSTLYGEERAPADAPFHAALHLDVEGPRWAPASLAVEGREQVFWAHEVGERWAAFARVGGVRVVVAATRWPVDGVRLAVVDRALYGGSTANR